MTEAKKIPEYFRSKLATGIKLRRRESDPLKRDIAPSVVDLGKIRFLLARHFGFCFGVENAIDIAYRAVEENPGRRVFLLSEMIHNPRVNSDLAAKGVKFLRDNKGRELVPFSMLASDDVVIIPAFGTSVEISGQLKNLGVQVEKYDTTCPFVKKVWKRAAQLGGEGYTIVIHGEPSHEETRATFSHACANGQAVVIRDKAEAERLARVIAGQEDVAKLKEEWKGRFSPAFDFETGFLRIGVVNQTTMLSEDTKTVCDVLRRALYQKSGEAHAHFADTRDTLCYATSENQKAIKSVIERGADLALVVGGYNSSNTFHLAELCATRFPTFYIQDANEIISAQRIRHKDMGTRELIETDGWLGEKREAPLDIVIGAGASCPDALVDEVMVKVAKVCGVEEVLLNFVK